MVLKEGPKVLVIFIRVKLTLLLGEPGYIALMGAIDAIAAGVCYLWNRCRGQRNQQRRGLISSTTMSQGLLSAAEVPALQGPDNRVLEAVENVTIQPLDTGRSDATPLEG